MRSLEIVEIGDGLGVILPNDILPIFKDAKDGTVFLMETTNGFTLTTVDPNTATTDSSSQ
ncbi:hypothetical protein HZ993_09065 [Rhodoferax sp. AJA081-3]|uniref:hypothetical protein n=1 Tax=Rhodoferax sp. AJA081-3 TaxID=2752316 RepID=UPI001AE00C00|nr:hypothetical protein [Rhodoferax sp. AJA081-3]QTN29935.1 hypothetical protein HZ993_09065 [Rhodoferax sp. AJA081-3]